MRDKPDTIDTRYFDIHPRHKSLVLDYAAAIQELPESTGEHYVTASDYRLKPGVFFDKENARF